MSRIAWIRRTLWISGIFLVSGCANGGGNADVNPPSSPPILTITAAQCAERKLPEASILVDAVGPDFDAQAFPGAGLYALLSGPPGGPLSLAIKPAPPGDLAEALRARGHGDVQKGTVSWRGKDTAAVASVFGESQARAQVLHVVVPSKGGPVWIEIESTAGTRAAAPAELAEREPYRALLGAVRIE